MAPGVHFQSADYSWKDLHPWTRPKGIVAEQAEVGIRDTQWHHIAWQYSYAEDLHQLFLDGTLIWQMRSPDGRQLVNRRQHDAQFSVCTRLRGYARYGGAFNWLGWGNFFGDIGEIRISIIRRFFCNASRTGRKSHEEVFVGVNRALGRRLVRVVLRR